MDHRAQRFYNSLQNKRVAFAGIGVSHTELIRQFAQRGLAVIACDRRSRQELGELANELEALGVELRLGGDFFSGLCADVLFRTPGMNWNHPGLRNFRGGGGVVTSEMEVFFDLCPCEIYAVTGSDGKTTTSTLIAELLRAGGRTVHLGGNIGKALLPCLDEIRPLDAAVVELSSFQLISMRGSPQVAVVTNVAPNHLDIHTDMQEYIDSKKNIFLHQNAFSTTVLNRDNDITASFAPNLRGRCAWFSLKGAVERGAYLEGDTLYQALDGRAVPVMTTQDILLPGIHNVANYLAAIAALGQSLRPETVLRVAREFGGVEHRIEFVREKDGVRWYNDSIATSPTRAIAGLCSFPEKIILLGGGYDKKIPFEPLAPEIIKHVKLLILTGHTADKIEAAVRSHPDYQPDCPQILRADSVDHAVGLAHAQARPGDVVSLSPACASFDCYPNFEARGRHFKELVNAL